MEPIIQQERTMETRRASSTWRRAALVVFILTGFVARLQAQGGVAQIAGTVKDSS
jgi:hypothetical protein